MTYKRQMAKALESPRLWDVRPLAGARRGLLTLVPRRAMGTGWRARSPHQNPPPHPGPGSAKCLPTLGLSPGPCTARLAVLG